MGTPKPGAHAPSFTTSNPGSSIGESFLEHYQEQDLFDSIENGNVEMVKKFVKAGISLDVTHPEDGRTLLHIAVAKRHSRLCILLMKNGAQVNVTDIRGRNPMFYAVENNDLVIARSLLMFKSECNFQDYDSVTCVMIAATNNHTDMLELLLSSGKADPTYTNSRNMSALHQICAKAFNRPEKSVKLLLQYGADVNQRGRNQWTPLHFCILSGKLELAMFLVMHCEADPSLRDDVNETPLDLLRDMHHELLPDSPALLFFTALLNDVMSGRDKKPDLAALNALNASAAQDGDQQDSANNNNDTAAAKDFLNLEICFENDKMKFKVKPTTKLAKVFNAYCDRRNLCKEQLRLFDEEGTRIDEEHTVSECNLEDNCQLTVQRFQTGGAAHTHARPTPPM